MAGATWQTELRARGYRLTPQRQLVLEAVDRLGHATPDDLVAEVRKTANGVNISTVYRTLELLEGLGLVTHAHLGHGAPTYHAVTGDDHVTPWSREGSNQSRFVASIVCVAVPPPFQFW